MKRALKIVSPRQNMVRAKSVRMSNELAPRNALSEQELAHMEKNQVTLNTINELVRTISHYLNTPLTVLLGKVDVLSEATESGGMSKEDMKKFVGTCKREIFKIDAIVKSFQNLCRVQHKNYPPGVRMLDVEQEIKDKLKAISFLR